MQTKFDGPESSVAFNNRILRSLPSEELDILRPHCEMVSIPRGTILAEACERVTHCYFPQNGMISLLSVTEQGQTVEVCYAGYDGMVGLAPILGHSEMPYQALVQAPTDCVRVDPKIVLQLFYQGGVFHGVVLRYIYVMFKQFSQTCLCNHFHTIEARFCRWLTVMCDRSNNHRLQLTQEFIAHMLGVQRTSVGLIANSLQRAGVIKYGRGKVEVLDYERVKGLSCECYFVVRDEYESFVKDKKFPIMSGS
jgi:CRP-like cAMP-binding protein